MNTLFKSANKLLKNKASVNFLQKSLKMFSRVNTCSINKPCFYKINQKNFWKKKPDSEKKEDPKDEKEQKEQKDDKQVKNDKDEKPDEEDQKPPKGFEKFHRNNKNEDPNNSILFLIQTKMMTMRRKMRRRKIITTI